MQIKESDVEIIKKWIEDHWEGEPLCPVCKNNNWFIGRTITELRPFGKGKLVMGGHIYPVITFSCNICGHTLFFNAIRLDIVKLPPPPPPKEGDGVITSSKEVTPPVVPPPPPPPSPPPPPPPPPKRKEGDNNG